MTRIDPAPAYDTTATMADKPWMISLHGGHCGQFCGHAEGTLEERLEAAVRAGFRIYGISEHAPRIEERFVFQEERQAGYDVARLLREFEGYAQLSRRLKVRFADRLRVLRGFEAEVVPSSGYVELMSDLRRRHDFEYMVGSVHHVDEIPIDGPEQDFAKALQGRGGLENLAVEYYRLVQEMVLALSPEVVGHLDLIRLHSRGDALLETPRVRRAAFAALEAAATVEAVLDVSTAGYRKGLGSPYPAPWLVRQAHRLGIGFCLGDDSHSDGHVGQEFSRAREYLVELGIRELTSVAPRESHPLTGI